MSKDLVSYLNRLPSDYADVPPFPALKVPVESYNPFQDIAKLSMDDLRNKKLPYIEMSFQNEDKIQNSAAKRIKSNRLKSSAVAAKLGPEFLSKVKEIAKRLKCDYKDLIGLMNSESGLNPQAVNKRSRATGLIQFMPATARELGTTVDELRNMSALEQLDYVEKYLSNAKNIRFGKNEKLDAGELYALTYLPARANRSVLAKSHEKYYTWNRGLDLNGDGKITKSELAQRVQDKQVSDMYFA